MGQGVGALLAPRLMQLPPDLEGPRTLLQVGCHEGIMLPLPVRKALACLIGTYVHLSTPASEKVHLDGHCCMGMQALQAPRHHV